jgi:ATP-dependent helicase HepA
MEFIVGQRWISHAETQLGLGIVTEAASRRIKMIYPAVGEERIYATHEAPLSRIRYNIGDKIVDSEDQHYLVEDLEEQNGLVIYSARNSAGETKDIHEIDLNCFVQFTTPQQRLFSGQLDKNKNFDLRVRTMLHLHRLQQSKVAGLLGSRTSLLPHQISIASDVARRHAPRVLLADEVGLGKTIEAGMILHHQLHTGQSSRVLILVPDSLIHQWLVEMLRRFNLSFSIFDQERVNSMLEDGYENPFDAEQRILCLISLLSESAIILEYVASTHWDMLIVDEAHHLTWSEEESSQKYQCVQQLADHCESILLLTATPEQVGLESHFARLRLLDPARFHDLQSFKEEQKGYQQLNNLVQPLLNHETLNASQQQQLEHYLGEDYNDDPADTISKLLDRHGTGRVLFRNTRSAVKGFPKRCANAYPLVVPAEFAINHSALYPENELTEEQWLQVDPRVAWLVDHLKSLKPEKVLVICHHAKTAIALDNYLNLRMGIRSSSFYEGLSIIERDRAAAYFAEGSNPEELDISDGAQVLICSEIGSEGRNFQFAHHLVLFDLPLNPDLLEQRIGRLDRIGQTEDIQIHIPYLKDTAQEVLFRWHHEGIQIFSQSCSAGYEIYLHFADQLETHLNTLPHKEEQALSQLINDTAAFTQKTMQSLHEGRDRLLELNSCKHDEAQALIEQIHAEEHSQALSDYMELVFDQFGVDSDFHSEHSFVISPSDHMHESFPGLREEGNTITFDRAKALRREDMEFVSWEHPMVTECMEKIHQGEFGNTALAVISIDNLTKGTLFIETWYAINIIANKQLQLERYLPIHPTRFLLDNNGKDYSDLLSYETTQSLCHSVPKKIALNIAEKTRSLSQALIEQTQKLADQKLEALKATAMQKMHDDLGSELKRLKALRKVNNSIRDDEIDYIQKRIDLSAEQIGRSKFQLQAIRLMINN